MNPASIAAILATYHAVKADLAMTLGETDADALHDTASGEMQRSPDDLIAELVRSALADEAHADGIGLMIDRMKARQDRIMQRAAKARSGAMAILEALGKTKLMLPEATVSVKVAPAKAIVTDEAALPDRFRRVKTEPDKQAIRAALVAGEEVPGAVLSNPMPSMSITVR